MYVGEYICTVILLSENYMYVSMYVANKSKNIYQYQKVMNGWMGEWMDLCTKLDIRYTASHYIR